MSEPRRHLLAALVLLAGILAYFHRSILDGRTPQALGDVYSREPWMSLGIADPPAANGFLNDRWSQLFPWNVLIRDCAAGGASPMWNPYSECGVPHAGNDQSAVFFPLTWLCAFLDARESFLAASIVKTWIAGFFTYALVFLLTRSCSAGVLSGFLFSFCGFLVTFLNFPLHNSAVFLPALVFLLELFCRRGKITVAVALGLTGGLALLAGHVQTDIGMSLFLALYALPRAAVGIRRRELSLLGFAAGIVVALLLAAAIAAPHLAATAEYVRESAALMYRESYLAAALESPSSVSVLHYALHGALWIAPDLFGQPSRGDYHRIKGAALYHVYYQPFVTPLGVLLAAVGFWTGRRSFHALMLGGLFLLFLSHAIGVEFVQRAVAAIPWLGVMSLRCGLESCFAAAVLAGYGLAAILRANPAQPVSRLYALPAILFLGAAGAGCAFEPWILAKGRDMARERFENDTPEHQIHFPLEGRLGSVERSFAAARNAVVVPGLLLAAWGAGLWLHRSRPRRALVVVLTVGAAWGNLYWVGRDWNPEIRWIHGYSLPSTPHTDLMTRAASERWGRVYARGTILYANSPMAYRLPSVKGHDSLGVLRYKRVLWDIGRESESVLHSPIYLEVPGHPFLDLAGARYVVSADPIHDPDYRLLLAGSPVRVYENARAFPRAFCSARSVRVGSAERVVARILEPGFRPSESVLLEGDGPELSGELDGECEILEDRGDRIVIRVRSGAPNLLVLTDSYYPGWVARVDGEKRKILPAYHAFRAVEVGLGDEIVEFSYEPSWRTPTVGLSALALLFAAGTFVRVLILRLRR